MTPHLHRLSLALALSFVIIALTSGYWGLVRRDELLARPDNPRRILAEQRQPRGSLLDRNGEVLAESIGAPGGYERHYPYPDLAPVLGYVSPFYGLAGIEAAEDAVLHGDAGREAWEVYWQDTVGQPVADRSVRLTIDLPVQRVADESLGDETGAIIVLDVTTGEILALASQPTFDPNQLEDNWQTLSEDSRAPLLNRALFGLYQPGGALQPALLAAALDRQIIDPNTSFPTTPIVVDDMSVTCRDAATRPALLMGQAFQSGCPALFVDIGRRLGSSALNDLFSDWRLYEAPSLGLPTTASPLTNTISDLTLSALGQDSLTVTPLHMALLTAAIAHQGEIPAPRIIQAVQNMQGEWEPAPQLNHPVAVFNSEATKSVAALMPEGHSATALSGEGANRTTLTWFSGFAPLEDPRYAVVVLLEEGNTQRAQEIGRKVLAATTTP